MVPYFSSICTDLAEAGHAAAIPLDPELEVFVGIEAGRVHTELRHQEPSLRLSLSGHLLDRDDHELGRLEGCEADQYVDYALIDVGLCGRFLIDLDEVSLPR